MDRLAHLILGRAGYWGGDPAAKIFGSPVEQWLSFKHTVDSIRTVEMRAGGREINYTAAGNSDIESLWAVVVRMVGQYKPPYDTFVRVLANGATVDAMCSDPALSTFMFTPDGKKFYRHAQEEGAGDADATKVRGSRVRGERLKGYLIQRMRY